MVQLRGASPVTKRPHGPPARTPSAGRAHLACVSSGGLRSPVLGRCAIRPAPTRRNDEETTSIDEQQRRINAEIKVPRVRLVDADATQVGIVPLAQALRRAREQDLDLVEVAAQADPPVCRIMDWGKHRYEQEQKDKDARKRQNRITVKEIKMRPKISGNDYGTKAGHVRRFLEEGAKVRASIMFRGREMAHTELGLVLLQRLAEDMGELATVEAEPAVDGRNMVMILAPHRSRARVAPTSTLSGSTDDDLLTGLLGTSAAPEAPNEVVDSIEVDSIEEDVDQAEA
jgi:translation initiation factor IF-3